MTGLPPIVLYLALTAGAVLAASGQVLLKLGADGRPSLIFFGERPSPIVLAGWAIIGLGVAVVAVGARA